jgi:hypothetical protein
MIKTTITLAALVVALAGCRGGGGEYGALAPPLPVAGVDPSMSIGATVTTGAAFGYFCTVPREMAVPETWSPPAEMRSVTFVRVSQSL